MGFSLKHIRTLITSILIVCTLLACALLVSCGFALKHTSKPLPFTIIRLQTSSDSLLLNVIKTSLVAKGIQVVVNTDSETVSLPLLLLSDERREKVVLSTNATGRVREYQLRQSVTVRLFDTQNNIWLDTMTFNKQRDFTYNDNLMLAKELEEANLYRTIQDELNQAVLTRLSAATLRH
ncbi:MAG: hypothetical protein RI956_487 [Pseudomonadota bacterium]|jgi:LPS-assembly lipoprotein